QRAAVEDVVAACAWHRLRQHRVEEGARRAEQRREHDPEHPVRARIEANEQPPDRERECDARPHHVVEERVPRPAFSHEARRLAREQRGRPRPLWLTRNGAHMFPPPPMWLAATLTG